MINSKSLNQFLNYEFIVFRILLLLALYNDASIYFNKKYVFVVGIVKRLYIDKQHVLCK